MGCELRMCKRKSGAKCEELKFARYGSCMTWAGKSMFKLLKLTKATAVSDVMIEQARPRPSPADMALMSCLDSNALFIEF